MSPGLGLTSASCAHPRLETELLTSHLGCRAAAGLSAFPAHSAAAPAAAAAPLSLAGCAPVPAASPAQCACAPAPSALSPAAPSLAAVAGTPAVPALAPAVAFHPAPGQPGSAALAPAVHAPLLTHKHRRSPTFIKIVCEMRKTAARRGWKTKNKRSLD